MRTKKQKRRVKKGQRGQGVDRWWKKKRWWGAMCLGLVLMTLCGWVLMWELAKPGLPKDAGEAMRELNSESMMYLDRDEYESYMRKTDELFRGMSLADQKRLVKEHGLLGAELYGEWKMVQHGRSFAFAKTKAERDQAVLGYMREMEAMSRDWGEETEAAMNGEDGGSGEWWGLGTTAQEDAYMAALDEAVAERMGVDADPLGMGW
ncbi:hypothetical protein KS4_33580 [Poriferisphaera corsica]|uniref:Uncharacterized protein n=1 Tax=Poriferisphaera corsica TaxID=2528020 RepID=A0A517YYK3_9BACT|nr:hypothetical protein [Poriferisphaera corsica]QDU35277.1 hypothetical protein KS4_33580 [Poriferisphaera corsica]